MWVAQWRGFVLTCFCLSVHMGNTPVARPKSGPVPFPCTPASITSPVQIPVSGPAWRGEGYSIQDSEAPPPFSQSSGYIMARTGIPQAIAGVTPSTYLLVDRRARACLQWAIHLLRSLAGVLSCDLSYEQGMTTLTTAIGIWYFNHAYEHLIFKLQK